MPTMFIPDVAYNACKIIQDHKGNTSADATKIVAEVVLSSPNSTDVTSHLIGLKHFL